MSVPAHGPNASKNVVQTTYAKFHWYSALGMHPPTLVKRTGL